MTPAEIAAYVGAAAWLPPILSLAYRYAVNPTLRIVPDQVAEVSFTSLGPIFNIRMAFFASGKDLIVDGLNLIVRHEDGESREFRWAGLGETFSEVTDASGNKQIVGKDQTPIAIKVMVTQSLLEKFVRFQEPRFHAADSVTGRALLAQATFLRQKTSTPEEFVCELFKCKEYFDVLELRKKWLWWKAGRYTVTLRPSSPQKFKLELTQIAFDLTPIDIERIATNREQIENNIRNIVHSNLPDTKPIPVNYYWTNVTLLTSGT